MKMDESSRTLLSYFYAVALRTLAGILLLHTALTASADEYSLLPESFFRGGSPFFEEAFGGNQCSVTWLTEDGFALTAFHCLVHCMEVGGVKGSYNEGVADKVQVGEDLYARKINPAKLANLRCFLDGRSASLHGLDPIGNPVVYASGVPMDFSVRIVSLGADAWIPEWVQNELRAKNPSKLSELIAQGYTGLGFSGDFALIKVERTPPTPIEPGIFNIKEKKYFGYPPQCLPLRSTPLNNDDRVLNVAFPDVNRPKFGKHYNNPYLPVASVGRVFDEENNPSFAADCVKKLLGDDNVMLSSLDGNGGSSGSSVLDDQGRVAGVVYINALGRDQERFVPGIFGVIPIQTILKKWRRDLGDAFVDRLLTKGCATSDHSQKQISYLQSIPEQRAEVMRYECPL